MDTFRRRRVDLGQAPVQRGQTIRIEFLLQAGTDRRIGRRQIRQPVLQRPEIQHRAPDQQRDAASGGDRVHLTQRIFTKAGR